MQQQQPKSDCAAEHVLPPAPKRRQVALLTLKTAAKPLASRFEATVMNHPVWRKKVVDMAQASTKTGREKGWKRGHGCDVVSWAANHSVAAPAAARNGGTTTGLEGPAAAAAVGRLGRQARGLHRLPWGYRRLTLRAASL